MGTRDGASGAQLAQSGRGGQPGGVTRVLRLEWKVQPGTCRRQVLRGRNTRDAVGLPSRLRASLWVEGSLLGLL